MLDRHLAPLVGQQPPERIDGHRLVARPRGVVADRAEGAGDDDALDALGERGPQQVPGAEHVAGVDLALLTLGAGDLGRAVVDALAAADGRPDGRRVAEIAPDHLHADAGQRFAGAAAPLEDTDLLPFVDQAPDQVGAEMSTTAGHQDTHRVPRMPRAHPESNLDVVCGPGLGAYATDRSGLE